MGRKRVSSSGTGPPSPSPRTRTLDDGDLVGETYRVTSLIAVGGMGEVYDVVHTRLDRNFALKCLRLDAVDQTRASERFLREVRALSRLRSEHVVSISDCGELPNGAPYLVMERLQGQSLRQLLWEEAPLVPSRAVALLMDACLGLSAVHELGLVHRDLKPENLFVTQRDSGEEACKLLDFGIAKVAGNNSTRTGSLLGTLKYMAPEQIADSGKIGPWTDLYALGAILYECLCGFPPHQAETEHELMFKILNADVLPLEQRVPDVPPKLSKAIGQALQRDPEKRHPSARAFGAALAPFLPTRASSVAGWSAIDTRPHTGAYLRPAKQRLSPRFWFAALGVVATAFGVGWWVGKTELYPPLAAGSPPAAGHVPRLASSISALHAESTDALPAPVPSAVPHSGPSPSASADAEASAPALKVSPNPARKLDQRTPVTLRTSPKLDPSPYD